MSVDETDILAGLIGRKHECLVQLRALETRQLELICNEDITTLLDLLSAKQGLLREIQRIERALHPFRRQPPGERRWRTPEDRQRCASRLAQCEALLKEIVDEEKRSEQELSRRRDATGARLQGAHLASRARGRYTAPARESIRQIDLSSDSL